ncbi:MAG: McrC family protein, partial [Thermoleophilia bacterium]
MPSTAAARASRRVLELEEYVTLELEPDELDEHLAEQLWRQYKSVISIEFPSVKTGGKWQLTPQGWVGYIVFSDDLHLRLKPKVPLGNLFRMLEYAYRLKFHLADGLVDCASLDEFYERLAHILARRVLDRGRKGYYRTYVSASDALPYVRGQVDARRLISRPWETQLQCLYEEHTGDIVENQILAWTLHRIARSGRCGQRVMPAVRTAYRSLQSFVSPVPQPASACVGRLYNRLNDDYEPLHGLCRFFLEHSGPHLDTGDRAMLPFLIDMNRLFELFVAEWLRDHLPKTHGIKAQEHVEITSAGGLEFVVDLVLYDAAENRPICV